MNEHVHAAFAAAKAFCDAEQAYNNAKEALMPYAKQQVAISRKVVEEYGLKSHYAFRAMFYYDWLELTVSPYYQGASRIPVITCEMWERGRCGNPDAIEGTFDLHPHIINDEPDKFEAHLRATLQKQKDDTAAQQERQKQERISKLQAELQTLQGGSA